MVLECLTNLLSPACIAALEPGVSIVVERGSEKQMIRPDARRIIAGVADVQASRDRAVVEFIGEAMNKYLPPGEGELPIPFLHRALRPNPTPFGMWLSTHIVPEPVKPWL